jgi:hypothetical protein
MCQTVMEYLKVKRRVEVVKRKRRVIKNDLIRNIGYKFKRIFEVFKTFICSYNTLNVIYVSKRFDRNR